jgi:hypothetical protein
MPANKVIKCINPVGGALAATKALKKLAAKAPPMVCRGHQLYGVLTSPGKSATIAGFEIPLAIAR